LVAKSIGGGLPLGAMLTKGVYDEAFTYGVHGSTFGGNSVSCAAGIVVLEEVFGKGLINSVAELGEYIMIELKELARLFPSNINDVRGLGFMIGIEMAKNCDTIVKQLGKRKVLINCTNRNVVRILPPLIATKNDIDFFLYNFHQVLKSL
jgi:acetylornithine/succinyldiaminopimelate/putrescine aminotransferase